MAMVVKANSTTNVGGHISTLRLGGDALRSGVQPFLSRAHGKFSRRHRLFSGPRRAGHVCARVSRRPAGRTAFAEFPAGTRRRRRAVVVSASVFDAGFLAIPDGLDGARPDHVAVSGAVQPLPAGARPGEMEGRAESLGVPRRRRMRRAGNARRHHARRAREPRQSDLGHQLQFAAARRPGARQRKNHPGTRRLVPRRGLERHQGHLGHAIGTICSRATNPACCSSAWKNAWTAITRNIPSSRAATRANISSANIPNCSNW